MAHHGAPQGSPDPGFPCPRRMQVTSPEAPATRATARRARYKPTHTGACRITARTPSRLYNGILANHFFFSAPIEKLQFRAPGARATPGGKKAAPQCGLARFGWSNVTRALRARVVSLSCRAAGAARAPRAGYRCVGAMASRWLTTHWRPAIPAKNSKTWQKIFKTWCEFKIARLFWVV